MWQYFRFTLSLNKSLPQSEKALQTVDMEFNTRNAFAPRKGNIVRPEKRNARKERDFVDILYSVNQVQCTFDSPLTPNKSDDSFFGFSAIFGDEIIERRKSSIFLAFIEFSDIVLISCSPTLCKCLFCENSMIFQSIKYRNKGLDIWGTRNIPK